MDVAGDSLRGITASRLPWHQGNFHGGISRDFEMFFLVCH
jgi:hypothetical protein